MPLATVGNIELYYETYGSGRPLVLINGFASSSEMWSPFWKVMVDAHEVILFDNRGVGRSTIVDEPYSIRSMSEDTLGLLEVLGLRQVSVFGSSMGGMIAQQLTLDHPDRVVALILGMTSCGGSHVPKVDPTEMLDAFRPRSGVTAEEMMEARWRLFYSPAYLERHRQELAAEARGIRFPTSPVSYRYQSEATMSFDAYDRLPEIRVPTLVMAGSLDRLFPVENAHILASRIQGARLRIFEGAGHAVTRERERDVIAEIRSFLHPQPLGY